MNNALRTSHLNLASCEVIASVVKLLAKTVMLTERAQNVNSNNSGDPQNPHTLRNFAFLRTTGAKHQIFCSDLLTFNVMKMGQLNASAEVNGR